MLYLIVRFLYRFSTKNKLVIMSIVYYFYVLSYSYIIFGIPTWKRQKFACFGDFILQVRTYYKISDVNYNGRCIYARLICYMFLTMLITMDDIYIYIYFFGLLKGSSGDIYICPNFTIFSHITSSYPKISKCRQEFKNICPASLI